MICIWLYESFNITSHATTNTRNYLLLSAQPGPVAGGSGREGETGEGEGAG